MRAFGRFWVLSWGSCKLCRPNLGFEARINDVFADFLAGFGSDCGGLEAPISDLGRYLVGSWCQSKGSVLGRGNDFAA